MNNEEEWLESIINEQTSAVKVHCSSCNDAGFIIEGQYAKICENCSLEKLLHQHYKTAGIPKAYYKLELTDWNPHMDAYGEDLTKTNAEKKSAIGEFVKKYDKALPAICAGLPFVLKNYKGSTRKIKSLHFSGGKQSGKTLLAASLAKSAVRNGITTKYYNFSDLFAYLNDFDSKEIQHEITDEFLYKELIIIDNVEDVASTSSYLDMAFDRIARKRLDSENITIITSIDGSSKPFLNQTLGSGWQSLVDDCFKIKLPTTKKPNF